VRAPGNDPVGRLVRTGGSCDDRAVEFRILGPLEVRDADRVLPLGTRQQRALLAFLLLYANQAIPRDRLIDGLWGDEPPRTAVKALQGHVSTLRRLLEPERTAGSGAGVLLTRGDGYELRVDDGQLDLERFERLRREGRSALTLGKPDEASELLRGALALWRGSPLPEFAYEAFAQAELARLEELRLSALEDRIDADLACGRQADVIGELEALTRERPLRERIRGQLMLGLYRAGRQADALAVYQAGRAALVDELGIEPGPALRELHQAILRQDPKLGVAQARARTPGAPFVGREEETAALVAGLDDVFAGRGRVFLLVGEPGIGKSRLADELVAIARDRGARVLVGRAWEAGGAPAYWPWVQALRAYIRESDPATVRAQLGDRAADLAQLLPELRAVLPEVEEPSAPESDSARFRLFEAVSSLLLAGAQDRPIVMVLDDLHVADQPSLLLLRFVSRELAAGRLLLVCAFRNVDPRLSASVSSALAAVARESSTTRLELDGLGERDVAEFIHSSTGIEPAPQLVRAVHAEADGNPLFVGELVRLLDAEGRLAGSDGPLGIPPGVRAVIGQRVGRLSEHCRLLLVPASVVGRDFALELLARITGVATEELADVLDEAAAERLIGEVPGAPGRLRFSHALIRDTLYDELTPARRMRLHREVGKAIEATYAVDLGGHLSELAHHYRAAAPVGAADKAVAYARRAGDRALELLAFEEAARLYDSALALTEEPPERCELLLARGDAEARAGETEVSKRTLREVAELANRNGLPEHLARAALGYGGRLSWETSKGDEAWAPLLERALAALPRADSPLRVWLLARLAGLREAGFVRAEKIALGREGVEIARRLGDPATLARALAGLIPASESPDNVRELLELSTEFVAFAHQAGDRERALEAHEHCLIRYTELGNAHAARAELEAMKRLAAELQQPAQQWLVAASEARQTLLEGKLAEAEALISGALHVGERAHAEIATNTFRQQLYLLRREQGRLREVEDLVRSSVVDYPANQVWRCVLTQVTAELGLEDESRHHLQELAWNRFADLPFQETWLTSLSLLAEAASALDDTDSGAILYELLLPHADRVAVSAPEISTGAVARYLGLLAAMAGQAYDPEHHFLQALKLNERIGARSWLAHTKADYGRFALARGGRGDRALAARLLEEACASYRELGMQARGACASAFA
jgi:DNA-binding SARP family transcriptional activator